MSTRAHSETGSSADLTVDLRADPQVTRRASGGGLVVTWEPPAATPAPTRGAPSPLVDALTAALDAGGDELEPAAVARARAALSRASGRLGAGEGATVVAVAGATGSGKSSMVNALAGLEVARVGVRRPTTSATTACVWGDVPEALLDWLDVPRRHRTRRVSALDADVQDSLEGLVLLDLPDHDSTHAEHRITVDRLVELVDLFVWVADPQKYADDALHAGYLRSLARHSGVVIVVLNQVDTLDADQRAACAADLRRLLDEDGLGGSPLLLTSARTGAGVEELREHLRLAVTAHTAAWARSRADLAAATDALAGGVAAVEPPPQATRGEGALVDALARAAGVPALVDAVRASTERAGRLRTGWPPVRWLARLRPDPLRRLHLALGSGQGGRPGRRGPDALGHGGVDDLFAPRAAATLDAAAADGPDGPADDAAAALARLRRTSLPEPTAAARAQVAVASRRVAADAAAALPPRWGRAVRAAADADTDDLADDLDRALASVPLQLRAPRWWAAAGAVQAVLAALAVVGAAWLVVLALLAWLQLPHPDGPRVGAQPFAVPVPTLLLAVGVVLGLLLAALARAAVRRHARRAAAELDAVAHDAVAAVAGERLLRAVGAVVERHRRTRDALTAARRATRV